MSRLFLGKMPMKKDIGIDEIWIERNIIIGLDYRFRLAFALCRYVTRM